MPYYTQFLKTYMSRLVEGLNYREIKNFRIKIVFGAVILKIQLIN